jgi:hypothetical protein
VLHLGEETIGGQCMSDADGRNAKSDGQQNDKGAAVIVSHAGLARSIVCAGGRALRHHPFTVK